MAEVSNFSIACQVECSPLCDIVWLKDGAYIGDDDERYSIRRELAICLMACLQYDIGIFFIVVARPK
jgi:hypothetical protein